MVDLNEVGAFASVSQDGDFAIRFGVYLPGIHGTDGFDVTVLVIHQDDRFDPTIPAQTFPLAWVQGHPLDLWTGTFDIAPAPGTHFGSEGTYLYRFQLGFTQSGNRTVVTRWFTDPFARATDVGRLSAVNLSRNPTPFAWTDDTYHTPELDDLVVYELQVEEFNDTFDGVAARLPYLQSIGVNCIELMPITSVKLDFDWGYGPLHYFAPYARMGGPDGLKTLVDACHSVGVAVILDVVYQHVDPSFPYKLVYDDVSQVAGAPHPPTPIVSGEGPFGPTVDFSQTFAQEYFQAVNNYWLDEYHVDGFRYDEVTDLYQSPTDTGYAKLAYETYLHSLTIPRFMPDPNSYSRIIGCAEALWRARDVLSQTYTNCAWQDDLLNQAKGIVSGQAVDASFAHQLDPSFGGYPSAKTVVNSAGAPIDMPVAPFQYLNSHDHSHLIVSAGVSGKDEWSPGDRSQYYLLQAPAIALYTLQGVPMLWQGEEFGEDYNLPGNGPARINWRRDTHWEYFYDDYGIPLIRIYRRLGQLRRSSRALRGRSSFYFWQQSLAGNQVIAYQRHAPATGSQVEEYAMVFLNFGNAAASIEVPFPKAGTWVEKLDEDVRTLLVDVAGDGASATVSVPSHYGLVFLQKPVD